MATSASFEWYVLVKYTDEEKNTEIVPVDYVQKLSPPFFDSAHLYNVFWSPDGNETLLSARTISSSLPTFPAKAGYDGAGYYKAHILLLEKSKSYIKEKMKEILVRRMLAQRNTTNSSISWKELSSSSREGSSLAPSLVDSGVGESLSRKRGCLAEAGLTGEKSRKITQGSTSFQNTLFGESDSEDEVTEASNDFVTKSSNLLQLEEKYKKAKNTIQLLQSKVEALENLNVQYQEHILKCTHSNRCQCLRNQVSDQLPIIQQQVLGSTIENPEVHSQIEPAVDMNTPVIIVSSTEKSNVTQDIIQAVELVEAMEHAEVLEPTIIIESGNPFITNQPNQNRRVFYEHALAAAGDMPQEEIIDLVSIYEDVFIDKRAWTPSFKNFVEHPTKLYGYGSKVDGEYIRDAALAMWGDKLKIHSVSGRQANANLKKDPNAKPPGPPLPKHEVNAIIGALQRRVKMELNSPLPPYVSQRDDVCLERRCKPSIVKYHIGQKIHSLTRPTKARLSACK